MKLNILNENIVHNITNVRYFTENDITIYPGSMKPNLKERFKAYQIETDKCEDQIWVPDSMATYAEIANANNGVVNKFYWINPYFLIRQKSIKCFKTSKIKYNSKGGINLPPNWELIKGNLSTR